MTHQDEQAALTLRFRERPVLCIGDSPRLHGKAERLYKAGARIQWWQAVPGPWLGRPGIERLREDAALAQDPPFLLLIDLPEGQQSWLEWARRARIPVWCAGDPEGSDVYFPSVVERGPLRVAVDTRGLSPTVSRWLRQRLEQMLPPGLSAVLAITAQRKEEIRRRLTSPHQRRSFWYRLLEGPVTQRAGIDDQARVAEDVEQTLSLCEHNSPQGQVFLVGAGPGDPDLLTVKALRLLGQADVVLFDRLVSQPIMDCVRQDAERIHVGKARANHSVPQDRINDMLVEYAQAGKTVVRLKGGDPFIFGRGGEEIETLADHGVDFQVVPGITAASGCAAYAGIPLTHRDYAQSVRFVTGHLKNDTANLPWTDLVQNQQTLVFYMGLVGLPIITRELMAHGMNPYMPVALVSKGTTPDQHVVTGTLEDIVGKVESAEVRPPTLVIVGEVVRLRDRLSWV